MSSPLLAGLRPVRDTDTAELIALIGAAYAEYPGCVLDLPGVDDDLLAPATAAAAKGGRWWVLERAGRVLGSVGAGPVDGDGQVELKRLYLDPAVRGQGIATAFVDHVERHAAGLGAVGVVLWSDSRFAPAHRRYQQIGYVTTGEHRYLDDPSETTEYRFQKPVTPAAASRTLRWTGPHGLETCAIVALPDGTSLRGEVGEVTYAVEVDDGWRTRRAQLVRPDAALVLSADGEGRWWRDGAEAAELAGANDVDLEVSPVTNALPIRRLALPVGEGADATAAWVRAQGPTVRTLPQHYIRTGEQTYAYRSGTFETSLQVDDDGFPLSYGTTWTRSD